MGVKETLFSRAKTELDAYWYMYSNGCYAKSEMEEQRQRFCSVYQVIEDAGLVKEYEKWKEAMLKKQGKTSGIKR